MGTEYVAPEVTPELLQEARATMAENAVKNTEDPEGNYGHVLGYFERLGPEMGSYVAGLTDSDPIQAEFNTIQSLNNFMTQYPTADEKTPRWADTYPSELGITDPAQQAVVSARIREMLKRPKKSGYITEKVNKKVYPELEKAHIAMNQPSGDSYAV